MDYDSSDVSKKPRRKIEEVCVCFGEGRSNR